MKPDTPSATSKSFGIYASAFAQLMKLRLSSLVVFSAVVTYFTATGFSVPVDWAAVLSLTLGGFLITGASNGFNQIMEKDLDRLMSRTANRPLPTAKVSPMQSMVFSSITALLGAILLWKMVNPLSGILGLLALVLYVALYTPMKQRTPFAVFVGAFPGAIPPLLGWVAATGSFSIHGWILFAIQFIWQFPHFWALAWILDDDYKKAGFNMLPSQGGRSKQNAFQILIYNAGLLPIGLLPFAFKLSGLTSAILVFLTGTYFLWTAYRLFRTCEIKEARKLLYASFVYLPVVQLALLFDRL